MEVPTQCCLSWSSHRFAWCFPVQIDPLQKDLSRSSIRQCYLYLKTQNERIPNHKDSDYFDLYENLDWKPTPWYKRILNFIYRFLYFITGPKFIVPISGMVIKENRDKKHCIASILIILVTLIHKIEIRTGNSEGRQKRWHVPLRRQKRLVFFFINILKLLPKHFVPKLVTNINVIKVTWL